MLEEFVKELSETFDPNVTEDSLSEFSKYSLKDWHKYFSMGVAARGEWAGCPLPIGEHKLVVEPRSPFANMNGMMFKNGQLIQETEEGIEREEVLINSWYSHKLGMYVAIYEDEGKRKVLKLHHTIEHSNRLDMLLKVIGAANDVWDINTELKAMKKLKSLVKPHIFNYYLITGSFIETSPRSNVTYLFRRSRPTIAIANDPVKNVCRFLTALCLHPIGYYRGTFAGTMVPTDDIIAHLLMMRGDEHMFWKKANHHQYYDYTAGL